MRSDGRGGRRWWNEKLPARYIGAIEERQNAEGGAESIDQATAQSEFVFLNLRLRDGFALADFHERFGRNFECHLRRSRDAAVQQRFADARTRPNQADRPRLEMADSVFAEFV